MKLFFALACLSLATADAAAAQESVPSFSASVDTAPASLVANSTPHLSFFQPLWNTPSRPSFADPRPAVPMPKPAPPPSSSEDNFRFDLGVDFAFVKFRSAPINASMVGSATTVGYHLTERFTLEATVTTAFGSQIFNQEHTKYLFFGGGPKIMFGQGRWRPFVRADFGLAHMLPQTAGNSQKGLGVQVGGGAELSLNPNWSVRLGGDYVRAQIYTGGQNNIQVTTGIQYHFH